MLGIFYHCFDAYKIVPQEDERVSNAAKKKKFRDEFDNVPSKFEPKYAYKRDAVRKKSERMKLKGTDCDCCRNFWKHQEASMGKEEAQKLKDKVSRHRDNFPRPTTPPGFWNPVFSSSSDSE